jgi:hypothetical protein
MGATAVPAGTGHIFWNSGSHRARRSSKDPAVGGFWAMILLISAISLFIMFPSQT